MPFACPALARCLQLHLDADEAAGLSARLLWINDAAELLPLYHRTIPLMEAALQASGLDAALVADLHALFVEMEGCIAATGNDRRHRLVVVIPVADRPQQLRTCLLSLVGMMQAFRYGADNGAGNGGRSHKLTVVIADDSCAAGHIAGNRAIAAEIGQLGLTTVYFGLQEQQAVLAELSAEDRQALHNIIGDAPRDDFCHKGASIMRNISYLMLQKLVQQDERVLFLFADSDQQFHSCTDAGREVFTTNYFYHMDRIFSQGKVQVLTGKVVGDPPVSPAVMAGTLLDDVMTFLGELAGLDAGAACTFHRARVRHEDAAYHDMAKLFGFEPSGEAHRFQCPLTGAHDHAACLAEFARRLDHFFDGEHPTRVTLYRHADVQASVTPARTVYTGNYVLSSAALKYFIPFAGLGLRMAGPVLGRLIQACIGDAFVSANLPMLHRRTVQETGGAEFRPGVDRSASLVDLSGEFERQFFGDVMLFAVIELVKQGYPDVMPAADVVSKCVRMTESALRAQYAENQTRMLARLGEFEVFLSAPGHWWRSDGQYEQTCALLDHFAASLRANFVRDARPYQLIDDAAYSSERQQAIVDALLAYNDDRECWDRALHLSRTSL
jgi:hypothetical protein